MTGENVSSWWKILMLQVCLGNSGEFALLFMLPYQMGGGHIDFDADPIGISIGVSLSCVQDIS